MSDSKVPSAPKGTRTAGRRLWGAVVKDYELAEHEMALLAQAARVADVCDDLQAVVDAEGPIASTRLGEAKAHPALVELRNQRLLLARLIVALRVPIGDAEEAESPTTPARRAQRRGVRGVYSIKGGAA